MAYLNFATLQGSPIAAPADVAIAPRTTTDIPLTFSGRGRGPQLANPQNIAVEASGSLVVVDGMFGLQAVVRVDAITGDRTIVSR